MDLKCRLQDFLIVGSLKCLWSRVYKTELNRTEDTISLRITFELTLFHEGGSFFITSHKYF